MLQLRIYIFVNLFNDSWRQAGGVEVMLLPEELLSIEHPTYQFDGHFTTELIARMY